MEVICRFSHDGLQEESVRKWNIPWIAKKLLSIQDVISSHRWGNTIKIEPTESDVEMYGVFLSALREVTG